MSLETHTGLKVVRSAPEVEERPPLDRTVWVALEAQGHKM